MKPNRLINETSPYLWGHALNPVDWHPWSEEAFASAVKASKPVLLSIGYSACHWCHVMEKESFSDEETARVMNDNFICIKVDREERPDIDSIYQQLGHALGRGGGWPLTVFMTPEKVPFYAGTYFPPEGRFGLPGFKDICRKLGILYGRHPDRAAAAGGGALSALRGVGNEGAGTSEKTSADASLVESAVSYFKALYDSGFGGFGQAPKFPCVNILELFMMVSRGDTEAAAMAVNTLREMARGGIFDHLGGGFHRYSTDRRWEIPHFEKMLYDNALLARVYTSAYKIEPRELFKDTVFRTLSFLDREMRSPGGGFYSSIDADTGGEEGQFYLWTMDELRQVLGAEASSVAAEYLGVEEEGSHVPRAKGDKNKISEEKGISPGEAEDILSRSIEALFKERRKRQPPFIDEKIIAAWNGMAISAFARAGAAFGRPSFIRTAQEAAQFVKENLSFPDGRLRRCFKDSPGNIPGFIDDYAYFIEGLADLYLATFSEKYLEEALRLIETTHNLFWNDNGYNYSESRLSSGMIYSPSSLSDGSFPSGAAVFIYNTLRLGKITDGRILKAAVSTLSDNGDRMRAEPFGHASLLRSLYYHLGAGAEAVISGREDDDNLQEMLSFLKKANLPGLMVFLQTPGSSIKHPSGVYKDGASSVEICGNFRCFPRAGNLGELKTVFNQYQASLEV